MPPYALRCKKHRTREGCSSSPHVQDGGSPCLQVLPLASQKHVEAIGGSSSSVGICSSGSSSSSGGSSDRLTHQPLHRLGHGGANHDAACGLWLAAHRRQDSLDLRVQQKEQPRRWHHWMLAGSAVHREAQHVPALTLLTCMQPASKASALCVSSNWHSHLCRPPPCPAASAVSWEEQQGAPRAQSRGRTLCRPRPAPPPPHRRNTRATSLQEQQQNQAGGPQGLVAAHHQLHTWFPTESTASGGSGSSSGGNSSGSSSGGNSSSSSSGSGSRRDLDVLYVPLQPLVKRGVLAWPEGAAMPVRLHSLTQNPAATWITCMLHDALRRAHQHIQRPLQLLPLAAHVAAAVDKS